MDKSTIKKNILIFFWYYSPPGGAELFIKEITERLSENHDFEIITAQCKKNLPKKEKINGVLVHRVGIGSFIIDKFLFPFFSIPLAFKIKKNKRISLVHGVIANPAGFSAMFFHLLTKTPFLLTEQSGNLDQKVRGLTPITFWIYKKIYQNSDFIHVISNFLKNIVLSLGVEKEKVKVIPNGINLSELKLSVEKGIEKEKYRIICVARLEKYKGIEYLIEALPKILESFPKTRLILIGDGQERNNLELKIKKLRLEDKVELKGEISHKEIPEELAKSNVFVLPSLEEGQGLVVLEAQAARIPVIGTRVGGIPDFIRDGESGILVEPKNPLKLAQSVIRIFSDTEFAQNLVKNASINSEKYDWHNIAEEIDQIYKQLIL